MGGIPEATYIYIYIHIFLFIFTYFVYISFEGLAPGFGLRLQLAVVAMLREWLLILVWSMSQMRNARRSEPI
jgi:hypothetical protein